MLITASTSHRTQNTPGDQDVDRAIEQLEVLIVARRAKKPVSHTARSLGSVRMPRPVHPHELAFSKVAPQH